MYVQVRNGHIKRITDQDIQSSVLEIMGTNVSTNYITCPAHPKKTLGIKLPFLVMIIKNVSVLCGVAWRGVAAVSCMLAAEKRRAERLSIASGSARAWECGCTR